MTPQKCKVIDYNKDYFLSDSKQHMVNYCTA